MIIALDVPQTRSEDAFLAAADNGNPFYILHSSLFDKISDAKNHVNFGENIAYAVGMICQANAGVVTEPLFISKSSDIP